MDEKTPTSWDKVMNEPIKVRGDPPIHVKLRAEFSGTFEEFCAWMEATFKKPENLPLTVIVGVRLPEDIEIPPTKMDTGVCSDPSAEKLSELTKMPYDQALHVVKELRKLLKEKPLINSIKYLREHSNGMISLRDSTNFVTDLRVNMNT